MNHSIICTRLKAPYKGTGDHTNSTEQKETNRERVQISRTSVNIVTLWNSHKPITTVHSTYSVNIIAISEKTQYIK